jgi:hydrophobic/amphiphilic exporter-1 (mainly G- bacteria), HAE1 family
VIKILAAAAKNRVFANLLMLFLVLAGLNATRTLRREMFPEFTFDMVTVTAVYPGATPAEIERSVAIKIEEAVRGLEGIHKVESTSSESVTTVRIEIDGATTDPRDALVDIRNEISRITTFPDDVEDPAVKLILNRRDVVTLALAAEMGEESLTQFASDLEEELLLLPEVQEVTTSGVRPYELSIHVREDDLQRYSLSFAQVTAAVRVASVDRPLGKMRSQQEERLLRVQRRRRVGRELGEIPVVTRPDGTRVLLRDVAKIVDGFAEDETPIHIDGKRAVLFKVGKTREQDTIRVAKAVKAWVKRKNGEEDGAARQLPEGVSLSVWQDGSTAVVDRLSLLTVNGLQGLVLVFGILIVFLGLRLSFWVALGLPVAFLAAMILLEGVGGSLNMISSFGLIMVLGILVDDAIVVAENIARHMQERGHSVESALSGLKEVAFPVIASVTTTAIAFMPLFYIGGVMGKFIRIMPVAVIAALIASLIECLLILPAHLAHGRAPSKRETGFKRLRRRIDAATARFIDKRYGPTIDWSLRNRYVVLAACAAFLIVVVGMVASGRPKRSFFPRQDSQRIQATITMPQGSSLAATQGAAERVAKAAVAMRAEYPNAADGGPIIRRVMTRAGEGGAQKAIVNLELARSSQREVKSFSIIKRWRELAGDVAEARSLIFAGTQHRPGGRPLEIRIEATTPEVGVLAAAHVREELTTYPGVFNLEDNLEPGKRELRFDLKPEADALGLSIGELARQLQAGYQGEEIHTIQRDRNEVEVRVRYVPTQREGPGQLSAVRLRLGDGLLPLTWAATVERARSLSRIERRNGRRVVVLTGDIDEAVTNSRQVTESLRAGVIQDAKARFPNARFLFGGQQEEESTTMHDLVVGFLLACFGIYVILALLFGSYLQPVIVMAVIPLGFAGAALGHAVLGFPLMIFSFFGMVGLTGIVVNDALVMIDFVNRQRRGGMSPLEAAQIAGRMRFRAVFLTTVTTVAGLLPIMLEESLQAQFVIPMAISISAGVATATVLTLYAVPCLYLAVEDLRSVFFAPAQVEVAERVTVSGAA